MFPVLCFGQTAEQTAEEFFLRGFEKSDLKDYYGAIADYTKAIELHPTGNCYFNRGIQKKKLNDNYGAIADFSEALKFNPKKRDCYFNRAKCKFGLNDNYGAIADYTKYIELDPYNDADNESAYFFRAQSKRILKLDYCADVKKACDIGKGNACLLICK